MTRQLWAEIGLVLLCIALYLVLAATFAAGQSIWVDETTQLVGLELSFGEQLSWLVGRSDLALGVPPDRMPPLSYWIGILWSTAFGLSEQSMRWMGIISVALAAPALYLSGRLVGGVAGGLLLLGFVLLSGTAVATATTIRAYPLYLLFISWAAYFYCLLIVRGDSLPRFVGIGLFLLAASYTHFFGIVAASSIIVALLADRLWRGQPVRHILGFGLLGAVALVGMVPFVLAALGVSSGAPSDGGGLMTRLVDTAGLAYRLVAHPAQLGVPFLTELHLAAVGALAFLIVGWMVVTGNARIPVALAMPLVLGFAILFAASMVIGAFAVHAAHYNLWMVPFAGLILACAFAPGLGTPLSHIRLWGARIAGTLAVCTTLTATISMARNAELYSNGPGNWMRAQISDWSDTLVVHSADGPWGSLYFALYYHSDGELEQWLIQEDGSLQRIGHSGLQEISSPDASTGSYAVTLQANSFSLNSREIADLVRGHRNCTDFAPARAGTDQSTFCAYLGVEVMPFPGVF